MDILSKSLIYFKICYKYYFTKGQNNLLVPNATPKLSEEENNRIIADLITETLKLLKECLNSKKVITKFTLIEFYDAKINKERMKSVFSKY
jgi:hypothetical protein